MQAVAGMSRASCYTGTRLPLMRRAICLLRVEVLLLTKRKGPNRSNPPRLLVMIIIGMAISNSNNNKSNHQSHQ